MRVFSTEELLRVLEWSSKQSTCSLVIKNCAGEILMGEGIYLGKQTNNRAEFNGMLILLKVAFEVGWFIRNQKNKNIW